MSPRVIPNEVFAAAAEHCQTVFAFGDAVVCTAAMLWTVLVWAAARTASLSRAVHRLYPGTHDQTFWNLLRVHLPRQVPALERRLNRLLRLPALLPRLAGRAVTLAVDYHAIPYYGAPKKSARQLRRGKPDRGTTKFHTYATVCVVVAGWRYTLALTWVRAKETPTDVLERLWAEVAASGIVCKTALLDRYFFTVPVMAWLQDHNLPFIIPVVMRGRKPKRGRKAKGMRACRNWKAGSYPYTHRAGKDAVDIRLVVTYKSYRRHRTKTRHTKKLFFATWKVRLSPVDVRETYRTRFGIEASYRQLNHSRARTSSRDPLYRLLLVGLSLFLRNVWQWLVGTARPSKTHGRKANRPVAASTPRGIRISSMTSASTCSSSRNIQTHHHMRRDKKWKLLILEKKTLHATERERDDVKAAREQWPATVREQAAERLIFLDETGFSTHVARLYGYAPSGQRLSAAVPHGHWKMTTFVGGLTAHGFIAPMVLDGAMTAATFTAYITQVLAKETRPGDVLILDNLSAHKIAGFRRP
ncbi:Mobile element protein [Fimbriiglobus ruber]|uniref:Mobile element protein n=1 Tax=Fimbriiglobus ruber TaxID=1908690 RepID=A0A225DVP2_9BACT|nr:Mobile element protein [Fimbriiglobus ruber]